MMRSTPRSSRVAIVSSACRVSSVSALSWKTTVATACAKRAMSNMPPPADARPVATIAARRSAERSSAASGASADASSAASHAGRISVTTACKAYAAASAAVPAAAASCAAADSACASIRAAATASAAATRRRPSAVASRAAACAAVSASWRTTALRGNSPAFPSRSTVISVPSPRWLSSCNAGPAREGLPLDDEDAGA
jgi:trimeric autotransporter adhesin